MRVLEPSFIIEAPLDGPSILKAIEKAGRTAYKTEDRITDGSAEKFVKRIIASGHESVIEHFSITVRTICDRGVSHEIVRHRIASFTQESTRYCNYADGRFGGEITVISPFFWRDKVDAKKYEIWRKAMEATERSYLELLKLGASPQEARSVLPNSLKTELVMTMNLREWRHFFSLRTADAAHPQMREIARPMLDEFRKRIPVVFDDILY
jgi:thymidylate synthase (FAD)